jgi:uracil-DNA glycosylase
VKAKRDAAITKMLQGWNAALALLQPAVTPDVPQPLVPYGSAFTAADLPDIPQQVLPVGSPPWMCGNADWARRTGPDDKTKRVTITVRVPKAFLP